MHILTDENGNPIPHGHDHQETAGEQGHCGHCCGGDEHADHEHEHGHHHHHHDHGHGPAPEQISSAKQLKAILTYMYQHNEAHTQELGAMEAKLTQMGHEQAAEQLHKALEEYGKGNMYLNLALGLVPDEE